MRKHIKKIIIGVVIAIIAVALVCVGAWFLKHRGKTYNSYTVKATVEFNGAGDVSFRTGEKNVIKYTRDGVSSYNSNGKEEWNVSYEMSNPIGDVCGNYSAVADKGSVDLYVMDGTGKVNRITTEKPIQQIAVADLGITAVWMDAGTEDYIVLYTIDGDMIAKKETIVDKDGIPVAMAISENGQKLVTSYAYLEENVLRNKLAFYNFGDVGSNYVDNLVGINKYEDRIVADIDFMGNDHVAVFSDCGLTVFEMEEYERELKDIEITDTIEAISVDSEYIGIVLKDEAGARRCEVYNEKGEKKYTKNLEKKYAHFKISGSDMIFYEGTELYIARINGNDKARIEFSMDITEILSVDGKKTYMIVGEKSVQTIELKTSEEEKEK